MPGRHSTTIVEITNLGDLRPVEGLDVNYVAVEVEYKGAITGFRNKDGARGKYLE
jgi:hypothetical protein